MKKILCAMLMLGGSMAANAQIQTNAGIQYLQAMQKDVSTDFYDLSNTYLRISMTSRTLISWLIPS